MPKWKFALMPVVLVNLLPGASRGEHLVQNILPLHGGEPFRRMVLPDIPPNGFYAWCSTSHGVCLVQGDAPIAPGLACYCGAYTGHTE
jgi:hypothetical protein